MSVPIGFDPASGNIIIVGNGTFPARSLVALVSDTLPNSILIQDTGGRGEQSLTWADVTSLDGSYAPSSMTDALAYLRGEFAKSSPGPRGPGIFTGPGDPDPAAGLVGDLYIDAVSGDLFSKGD